MANPKSAMFDRISKLSKNAPLHESGATSAGEPQLTESVPLTTTEAEKRTEADQPGLRRKTKAVRRAKNVQIPEDLWDAYDQLKDRNVTSLLMTPYILEAFREKLMRDGAFEKK